MVADPKGTIPAVAYYRMSTDKQDLSIGQQMKAVERYAVENGFRILRDYRDDGISGDATEKRLGFQQMIRDAARGDFRTILAWDIDRIGRFDMLEAGFWLMPLRQAGVWIATVGQGPVDLDDFGGRLIYSVQAEAKHAFLKDMAKAVARGRHSKAMSGRRVGGALPYGYGVEDGRLIVDPPRAAVVRRIFGDYDAGHSLRGIAAQLMRESVPTPRAWARRWSPEGLKAMLVNPVYIGTYRYNVTQRGKYARIRGGVVSAVKRGEDKRSDLSEAIVRENAHEAIIPVDLFERVGRKLAKNRGRTTRRDAIHPLTGLCRCAYCGAPMIYNSSMRGGKWYRYLLCHSRCGLRSVREETALGVVVGVIRDRLLAPKNAARLRDALMRRCRDKSNPLELDRLKREAVALEDDIAKARRRVVEVDSDMLSVVQEHLRDLRRRHEQIADRITELDWQAKAAPADVEAVLSGAMQEAAALVDRLSETDPRRLRESLRESIERIEFRVDREPGKTWGAWQLKSGLIVLNTPQGVSPAVNFVVPYMTGREIAFGPDDVSRFAA